MKALLVSKASLELAGCFVFRPCCAPVSVQPFVVPAHRLLASSTACSIFSTARRRQMLPRRMMRQLGHAPCSALAEVASHGPQICRSDAKASGHIEDVAAMPLSLHRRCRRASWPRGTVPPSLRCLVGASRDARPRLRRTAWRCRFLTGSHIIVAVRQRTEYVRQHIAASRRAAGRRAAVFLNWKSR